MTCFSSRQASGFSDSCCHGNNICRFSGNMDDVYSVPVYVQSIYDAVQFNLQGMKTVQNQTFSPAIPCGYTVSRICDIRTKGYFDPCNINDSRNLTVDMDTTLSGAAFLQDCHGNSVTVTGPDGTPSQKILYPDSDCCAEEGAGTQVFGTQNVIIRGNILVYVDLILCDNCNRETKFTVCAEVPVATEARPMCLTNFFEICIPASTEHAFLPRFTELSSISSDARLATNHCGRDINVNSSGEVCANLIISVCVTAEKTVVAPVQMCVLSTGIVDVPAQTSTGCNGFPSMFGTNTAASGGGGSCRTIHEREHDCGCEPLFDRNTDCGCGPHHDHTGDCGCGPHYEPAGDCGCAQHYEPTNDCGCGPVHDRNSDCGCHNR